MHRPLVRSFLLALCSGVVVFSTGCRPSFDVPVTSESTIQGSSLPGVNLLPFNFANFAALDLSSTSEFKNQGVSKDQVQSVKLKSAVLDVTAPAGGNFDFLKNLEFDVAKSDQDTKVPVAHITTIAPGSVRLTLDVDDVELGPYVTADAMKVTTKANGTPPNQDTTIKASLVFEVVPKIF
jgi:hypothetical protein